MNRTLSFSAYCGMFKQETHRPHRQPEKNISFFYSILKCSNVILFKGIVKLLYIMRFDNTLNKTLKKKFTFWTSFTFTIKI